MLKSNDIKTVIFDYDGTLHNSLKIYAPAFKLAFNYLVHMKLSDKREWSYKEISKWLGFSSVDMWNQFMPNLNEELKKKCSEIIGESMEKSIKEGKASLYDGSIDVLNYLKGKNYKLVFLSNCKVNYMNLQCKTFHLDRYFDLMLCTEQYDFMPKHKIFKEVLNKLPKEYLIIGDRFQDIEVSKKNNIYSIGCAYGYGSVDELKEADFIIHNIKDITKIL